MASPRPRDLALALVVLVAAVPGAANSAPEPDDRAAAEAPVLVGSSRVRTGRTRSIRLRRPARVQRGQVLVAAVSVRLRSARGIKAPAGWKLIRRDAGRGAALAQALYYRVASAPEPASYAWRFPRTAGAAAGLLAYGRADSARPVLAHNGRPTRNSRRLVLPALVTRVPDARVVGFFTATGRARLAGPAEMTKRYQALSRGRAGVSSSAADMAKADAGALSVGRASTASRRSALISQLVAIRPAPDAALPPQPPPPTDGTALPPRLPASTGQTFYVATTGSDSSPGTLQAPWRTVQHALDVLQPNQRALVRAGTYAESLDADRGGTAAATITVENYPGERPVVNGGGQRPLEVSSSGAYLRVRGFVFEGSPYASGGNVDLYGHHVEISGNEIRAAKDQGVYSDEESRNLYILGNWIHHNGEGLVHQSHGIYLQGNDHLVANNVIHDHPKGFGIQVYDRNSRSIVTANTVTGAGHSGIVVGGSGGVDNVRVVNNVFAFNAHYGISHDSTCPTSSRADHNVVFGNSWGQLHGGCAGLDYSGGNRTSDPLLVDYTGRNLHVNAGSPALDYALPAFSPGDDIDGRHRPRGGAPDAGAYER
jgi:Right handed beta helix region